MTDSSRGCVFRNWQRTNFINHNHRLNKQVKLSINCPPPTLRPRLCLHWKRFRQRLRTPTLRFLRPEGPPSLRDAHGTIEDRIRNPLLPHPDHASRLLEGPLRLFVITLLRHRVNILQSATSLLDAIRLLLAIIRDVLLRRSADQHAADPRLLQMRLSVRYEDETGRTCPASESFKRKNSIA